MYTISLKNLQKPAIINAYNFKVIKLEDKVYKKLRIAELLRKSLCSLITMPVGRNKKINT